MYAWYRYIVNIKDERGESSNNNCYNKGDNMVQNISAISSFANFSSIDANLTRVTDSEVNSTAASQVQVTQQKDESNSMWTCATPVC